MLEAAWFWGKENDHPLILEYPQVDELRVIGKSIGDLGGIHLMRQSLEVAKEMARLQRAYLGGYTAATEKAWNGIYGLRY